MALARAHASPQRFYSLSARIEAERRDCSNVLEAQQKGGLDITPWLPWFLDCRDRALAAPDGATAATIILNCPNPPTARLTMLDLNTVQKMLDPMFPGLMGVRLTVLDAKAPPASP